MAPKRKTTGGEKPVVKSSKKNDDSTLLPKADEEADEGKKCKTASTDKKVAGAKNTGALKEKAPPKQREQNDESKDVQWALPIQGKEDNDRDESQAITRYSEKLYNQTWGEIRASPFIIGPLIRYTIIELLSQPIFFFRNSEDQFFNDFQNQIREIGHLLRRWAVIASLARIPVIMLK
jgi:type IV secretory pathway VirB10-like protein